MCIRILVTTHKQPEVQFVMKQKQRNLKHCLRRLSEMAVRQTRAIHERNEITERSCTNSSTLW